MKRLAFCLLLSACHGSTGSPLVTFSAFAGGPADITTGATFTTGSGYGVALSRAKLHLASAYLNQTVPLSGAQESSCVQAADNVYVGEAFGPLDLDLLSSTLQPFSLPGEGIETLAQTGEVWLTGGAIDALDDTTVILEVAGTATKSGQAWPFTASVTIGNNRAIPVQNPALPGSHPICQQRIVTPIPVELTPTSGGTLTLRIDPRGMFNALEFSTLQPTMGSKGVYVVPDEQGGAGGQLFNGLRSNVGVYDFSFTP
ncbi:MAG: hypothetical protein ABI321_08570 [Polyangia bacterium]